MDANTTGPRPGLLLLGIPLHPGPRRSVGRNDWRQMDLLRGRRHQHCLHPTRPRVRRGRLPLPDSDEDPDGARRGSHFSGHERSDCGVGAKTRAIDDFGSHLWRYLQDYIKKFFKCKFNKISKITVAK